jgi:IPT/TIG domain
MNLVTSLSCLICALCIQGGCDQAPTPSTAVDLSTISPSAGPVGTTVQVTGSGFSRTGNVVKFGVGYVSGLDSPDGRTLRFVVPEHHEVCPPPDLDLKLPCAEMHPRVMPGDHPVSLVTSSQTSRPLAFTVTNP